MIILPIRTESLSRRTPFVNYLLIAANVVLFLLFDERIAGPGMAALKGKYLVFQSVEPAFHQFLTYQFLHADVLHLLGNMLFLWVFGNGVNSKMGDLPYLLFYLAGGVFAAWGYAVVRQDLAPMVGASGAIAAVTTAYLALFPRSRVTVLVWFFFIHFFEWPAMVLIGLKIIVWDNVLAPSIGGAGNIAHHAHLAGYLFGFVGALAMLLVRALPRDQFDIVALWRRWYRRREFSAPMSHPAATAERAPYASVAPAPTANAQEPATQERRLDELGSLRTRISELLERRDPAEAALLYERLVAIDPQQCLSERGQLEIAREFYSTGRFPQAAAAFDRFVQCYPRSTEATNVRFLLGIIYARELRQYEIADRYLTQSMGALKDEQRRAQCRRWLRDVRAALGREPPETEDG